MQGCALKYWVNTLRAWDQLDKELIAMVVFNVNHNHQILQCFKPTCTLFHIMLHPLTSRLVGVGVLSNMLLCSCSSYVSEACAWPT